MKKYNVMYGASIRAYGQATFFAENNDASIEKAKLIFRKAQDDIVFDDVDYDNMALPAIVSIQSDDEDVAQGIDFALTEDDALDFNSRAMFNLLKELRGWINDEAERRGREDDEYEEPAHKEVDKIDTLIAKIKEESPQ